ncbi:MAG TPA: FAD-linked oxidase C-terminal domain-containing protein, partial [Steroidobacteraceae bacterium]
PLMVDTLRPLRLNDTINATYTIVNPFRSIVDGYSMQGKSRPDLYQGRDSIPLDVVLHELAAQGKAPWNATFNLFDRDKGLDLRLAAVQEAFERIPGAKVQTRRWHQGQPIEQWMRVQPGLFALGIVDWYGGPGGHMNFAPVVAPIGTRVGELYEWIYQRFVEFGIDYYCGLLNVGARGLLVNAVMFFNRNDEDLMRRGRELYKVLAKEGAAKGFGDYRAHISFMDEAAEMYTFNGHALRNLNERMKDALDPRGVLAPGKQGIWPHGLRDRRERA